MAELSVTPVQAGLATPAASRPGPVSGPGGFGEALGAALGEVNRLQLEAQALARALGAGRGVDLVEVVVAAEKASLSFQLLLQLRNKLLEAYQEIMRMPV